LKVIIVYIYNIYNSFFDSYPASAARAKRLFLIGPPCQMFAH
jgi:hypothetical protein